MRSCPLLLPLKIYAFKKRKEKRLNDGNNNGQLRIANAISGGARKAAWAKICYVQVLYAYYTCHSNVSNRQQIGDRVGEGDGGGDGWPEEGQGEDHQGRDQANQVIHAQGHHQAEIYRVSVLFFSFYYSS